MSQEKTPFALLGGHDAVRAIVDRFYHLMDQSSDYAAIRAMHAGDLSTIRESLSEFLCGWLGGPPTYFQKPERRCVMSAHAGLCIGAREAKQWLACMKQALTECDVEPDLRNPVYEALARMADRMRNKP